MSNQRPTSPEKAVKVLLQEHGLQHPSAQFSATLTRLVVARYSSPPVKAYAAETWLGKAILWGLASSLLLLLIVFTSPTLLLSVAGLSVGAFGVGFGGLLWLLKQPVATRQSPLG
jgi:hypothetical protein